MADIELVIKISEDVYKNIKSQKFCLDSGLSLFDAYNCIAKGTPLTPDTLANLLMEERIRGKLDSDTTFEKDVIRDVKCRLSVSIRDHRPCYCGAELREVWRESEVKV